MEVNPYVIYFLFGIVMGFWVGLMVKATLRGR